MHRLLRANRRDPELLKAHGACLSILFGQIKRKVGIFSALAQFQQGRYG
jgi:hypothetical protein